MKEYNHESVKHPTQLPAMLGVLDEKAIKQYFPLDVFIPAHWHRSLEISFIQNMEVELQIGKNEYLIENDFTCINSGELHALKAKKIGEAPHAFIVIISYEFIKKYYPNYDNIIFDLNKKKDHEDLKVLYSKLEKLYSHQDELTYLDITACILEIISLLLREYKVEKNNNSSKKTKNQEQIKAILTFLHEHYQEDLSLGMMAKQFHLSEEYFSRQFHHYVGKTFRDYLASYRLYQAYDDVINSDKTVQDIARIHGFLNVKSFIKIFKDTYAATPLQYRKKMSKK